MKYVCDQMLGTLAKWLRFLGFDTFFAIDTLKDEELLCIAQEQKRILITRDKQLVIRARKKKIPVIAISTENLDEQIILILKDKFLDDEVILSRCSLCNSVLDDIDKKDVVGKVPEKIFKFHDTFWFCPVCQKIYWMGSHYLEMRKKIRQLQNDLSQKSD
jgi:uncharacterized protein with PIN domain